MKIFKNPFTPGVRVMGRPTRYGTVVARREGRITIEWDAGGRSDVPRSLLSLVRN